MIDDHAHPFDEQPGDFDPGRVRLDQAPAGSPPPVWWMLLRRRLADHLGVAEGDLDEARRAAVSDYPAYVSSLFRDAGITDVVMDPAWPPGPPERTTRLAELSGATLHLLLRIDDVVDRGVADGVGNEEIVERAEHELATAVERGFVGFKTTIAYRTGLDVDPDVTKSSAIGDSEPGGKVLRDYVFCRTLEMAAASGLPVQVHTGLGDADLKLRASNPILLENVLTSPRGAEAPVVLLHGSFPYGDEAAWLAASRPNVSVDVSLTPIVAPLRIGDLVLRLIDSAPIDRLLFGTDAYVLPELYWFGARQLDEAWNLTAGVLAEAGQDERWIDEARVAAFGGNARRLYRIPER